MLCCRDHEERVVASFSHKIQSEYYVGNILMSNEGIALEYFSTTDQEILSSYFHSCTRHAVFHSFMSDHINKYAATTTAHIK